MMTRRQFVQHSTWLSLGVTGLLSGCGSIGTRQKPDPSAIAPAPAKGKSLVVCQDGTWNAPRDKTNVWKVYEALVGDDTQRVYYHNGVGQFGARIVGGDFGAGTSQRIMAAYEFLARHYAEGDRICLFGFSRGAFAVRSLASFIAKCGLVRTAGRTEDQIDADIHRAYEVYLLSCHGEEPAQEVRQSAVYPCDIEMVGVWDTVVSLGAHKLPLDGLNRFLDGIHDLHPHENIRHGYHAMAIDEQRDAFYPTPWRVVRPGLEEVWFAGVHSNVGGGYPDSRLSDIALNWMVSRARCHGLRFATRHMLAAVPWPPDGKDALGLQDSLNDSKINATLFRAKPRMNPQRRGDPPVIPEGATLHWTVPIIRQEGKGYSPKNLLPGPSYAIATDEAPCRT